MGHYYVNSTHNFCSLISGFLQLVEKLLIAAVADADMTVRHSIFSSLHGNSGFDDFLAQADSLSAVFAALNDEVRNLIISDSCLAWRFHIDCLTFLVAATCKSYASLNLTCK